MSPITSRILASGLLAAIFAVPALSAASATQAEAGHTTVASGPTSLAMKKRSCGHTLRTVYHSCVFARHVAGYYRKSTGHGPMSAQLVSSHSGNFYQVTCNGWDSIVCYTERGKITFRVSKIPHW